MSEPTGELIPPHNIPKSEPLSSKQTRQGSLAPATDKAVEIPRPKREIILSNSDRIESVKLQLELLGAELAQLKRGQTDVSRSGVTPDMTKVEQQMRQEFQELQKKLIEDPDGTVDPWLNMLIQQPPQVTNYAEIIPQALETTDKLRTIDTALKSEKGGAYALLQLKDKLICGVYSGVELVSDDHNNLVIRFLSPTGNHFVLEHTDRLSFGKSDVSQLSFSPGELPSPILKPSDFTDELETYRTREEARQLAEEEYRLREIAKARESDIPTLVNKFKDDLVKNRPTGEAREEELTRIDSLIVIGDTAISEHLKRLQEAIKDRRVNPPSSRFSDTEQFLAQTLYLIRRAGITTSDPLSSEVQHDLDRLEAQIEVDQQERTM